MEKIYKTFFKFGTKIYLVANHAFNQCEVNFSQLFLYFSLIIHLFRWRNIQVQCTFEQHVAEPHGFTYTQTFLNKHNRGFVSMGFVSPGPTNL